MMKRLVTIAFALISVLVLVPSCEKAPFVTMTGPRTFTFTRDGGTQSFTFSCNRDWSVSSNESWIRVSPASGKASDGDITVTITCSPNTTYDARSATITVSLVDLSESLTVTQDTGIGLILSPTTFTLTNAAQDIEVEVQKNVQYSINIDEAAAGWIKAGGTKALTTDKVTFHISENKDYDGREGKITFKQTDGPLSETVIVRQSQKNGLFITTPSYDLSNEAHTLSVEVKANIEFQVTSQADWIKFVETKALTPSTVVLSIEANESYDNRTGTVLVKQTNGDLSGTITINQKQTDGLFVTPTSAEVSNQANTVTLEVKDNVYYNVVIPDDAKNWISVQSNTQTKALADDKVVLAIAANSTYDDREASVTIKQVDGALAETVKIKQGQNSGLFVTTSDFELSSAAQTVEVEVKANVEYSVTSEVDWIKYVETKALKASTIVLSISANETSENRVGKVNVKQNNGNLTESITITQVAAIKQFSINGFIQKGPFAKGSQITAFAMSADMISTGESYPANISNDYGAFEINGKTSAPFMELRANGYYFNEVEGLVSSSPLYLEAFVNSDEEMANINLLTTVIRPRIIKLIKDGKDYMEAKTQAQNELMKALGFTNALGDFDDLDITGTTEDDGKLLAFSCMIQCGRDPSEISTLVQEIASIFEINGELTPSTINKIKSNIAEINPVKVIKNLADYYSGKGLSITTIPDFFIYLDNKFDAPFVIVDNNVINTETSNGDILLADTVQIDGKIDVLSTIDFSVESDVQGVTIEKRNILGPAFEIIFTIPENKDNSGRTVHIVFKDTSNKVLYSQEFIQGGQYRAVDMGLGVYWATQNIGATSPEEYGDLFAWGEIEPKEDYDWSSYKWAVGSWEDLTPEDFVGDLSEDCLQKYNSNDNKIVLECDDDVAQVRLGGRWRMPTDEEWSELINNCSWQWTKQNKVEGCLVTSDINGNSIFLPASGYKQNTGYYRGASMYWSSTLVTGVSAGWDYLHARRIIFDKNRFMTDSNPRYNGFAVRPVAVKNND